MFAVVSSGKLNMHPLFFLCLFSCRFECVRDKMACLFFGLVVFVVFGCVLLLFLCVILTFLCLAVVDG